MTVFFIGSLSATFAVGLQSNLLYCFCLCTNVYAYMYIHIVCMHVCMCTCMYVHVCMYVYVCCIMAKSRMAHNFGWPIICLEQKYHIHVAGIYFMVNICFSATNQFSCVLFSFLPHQHHSMIQAATPIL